MKREIRALRHLKHDASHNLDLLLAKRTKDGVMDKQKFRKLTQTIIMAQDRINLLKKPKRDRHYPIPTVNPQLEEVERRFLVASGTPDQSLTCPQCSDRDHGNRKDGEPWCFQCNQPLTRGKSSPRNNTPVKDESPTFKSYDHAKRR